MKAIRIWLLYLTLWLLIIGGNLVSPSTAKENPPDFSQEGRPSRQTAGDNRSICPRTSLPLVALTPALGGGTTLQARPMLWFYLPYTGGQIHSAEFVLQNEQREDIQRLQVSLPKQTGFTHLTLPVALEVNQWYVWTLKLNCDAKKSATPIFVEGWIQRVAQSQSDRQSNIAAVLIWYDTVTKLATLYSNEPNNETFKQGWIELLETILKTLKPEQRKKLSKQPFVSSLEPITH